MAVTTNPPQNAVAATSRNWVSSIDLINNVEANLLHKPELYDTVVRRFGSQTLTGLMRWAIDGGMNPVMAPVYYHWEDDRLHALIFVQNHAAGAANATVTLTIASSATYQYPPVAIPPYTTASPTTTNPLINNQIMLIPNGGSGVLARVSNVNRSAGTFDVTPIVTGENIPAVTTATQIPIVSNSQQERDTQPEGRNWRLIKYTNNLQTMAWTASTSGQELGTALWTTFKDPRGGEAPIWFYEQQLKTYFIAENEFELTLRTMKKSTNATAMGDGTAITTEALYPFIENYGNVQNYSTVLGYQLADLETFSENFLAPNYGCEEYLWMNGINLRNQNNRWIRAEMKNGAVQYNAFKGGKDQAVNLTWDSIIVSGYTFHMKTDMTLSDPTTLGAAGSPYSNTLGVMIPGNRQVVPMGEDKSKKEDVPSLRVNYLKGKGNNYSRENEEWMTGGADGVYTNQTDEKTVNRRFQRGFQGFAGNRFGMQKGS